MGVISPQMVMCITYTWETNDRTKLDELIELHPQLFAKSGALVNSTVNYVMFWDGSKEGWGPSNEGNELRARFLKLCGELGMADIYEMDHIEGYSPKLKHTHIYNPQSLESTTKRDE